MAKPMTIVTVVADETDSNQPCLETIEHALRIRGHNVYRYGIKNLAVSADPSLPVLLHKGRPVHADAAIVRTMDGANLSVVTTLEAAGVPTLNSPQALLAAEHKGNTNALVQQRGGPHVPIPRSFNVRSKSAGLYAANHLGYPVVIKRSEGYGGMFVRKAIDDASATLALEELEGDRHEILVSDFVDCAGKALRILAIGGVAIRIGREHQAAAHEFRTQRQYGGTAEVVIPTEQECRLAEAVANLSGLGYVGLDISTVVNAHSSQDALQPESLVLFEINEQPELPSLTEATGYDFPGAIAEFLLAKARHWKTGGRDNPLGWSPKQPTHLTDPLLRKPA